jgi:polysaccharide export outer membrane protein
MRLMRRLPGLLVLLTLSIGFLVRVELAHGQVDNSMGGAGMQILQGLSPDQRNALSQQFGGMGGATGGAQNNPAIRAGADEEQQNLNKEQQRLLLQDQQKQRSELDRLSPFLQPDDWVVVTVDSIPLPGIPGTPGAQTPNPLTGLTTSNALPQGGALGGQTPALPGAIPGVPGSGSNSAALLAGQNGTSSAGPGLAAAAAGVGAASAASSGLAGQSVTAGGYAVLPPPCTGQLNCDTTLPTSPELTDLQKQQRQALIDLIRTHNPYQLGRDGSVQLPGFAPIPLAGLSEQLATLRLGVEPSLRDLFIRVTKLPLRKLGSGALKPFGYDIFDRAVSTFAPNTNVPVPSDYVVGPGDTLQVDLYGNKNVNLPLIVGRDGRIDFPELGPIGVGGQSFSTVKSMIEARVERQMIGVRASVTMGDTRSIRVFVLGDAKRPGTYTISGLGTITSALFAAGGVQDIGSLRDIQLRRHGELVRRLDLYDMLIRGNTTDDAKLLPGDVIFVPPIGATVTVDGEVHRPAIYELRNDNSVADVLQLAGGLTAEADTAKVALTRIDARLHRVVLEVNLGASSAGRQQQVLNGDMLRVARLRPTLDAGVMLQGFVFTPGAFAFREGMRLTDVVRSVDDLRPTADLHYVLIRRELPPDRRITVLSADLVNALNAPGSAADVPLMARDRITVFDLQSSRDRVIQPLLQDLKLQSNIGLPDEVVQIDGRANVPGQYPLESGMRIGDLIRAGGGLSDSAYGGTAELTRYTVVNGEERQTQLIKVDLNAALHGDPTANVLLQPFDSLSIKEIESWTDTETITLKGQVKFPGIYSIRPGETLKSVVMRAGGLTQYAFGDGAVFTRRELREREQTELDSLALRMQNDIAFVALQGTVANQAGAAGALSVGQSLLMQLRQAKAVGRLVINLPHMLKAPINSTYDVVVRDGDELIVPKFQQEVTVIGEVQTVTSHLYHPGLSRGDYISMSGGVTARADNGRIYVVRANGSVVTASGGRWFAGSNVEMQPGDTIVVPLNAEHMPPLPLWQAVSQILYNVAIAVLAIHEF